MVINLDLPANGETAYVDKYNAALTALATAFNGGIDQNNIADNSITTTKLLDSAVIASKVATDAVETAKIKAKAVTAAKIEDQQAWQAPTFQNSWQNYDTTYESGGYMKDSLGFVHIQVLVKSGVVGQTIFTLPAGYRPLKQHIFMVNSNNAVGRIDIFTDGQVKLTSGSNVYVSLSGIILKGEQ